MTVWSSVLAFSILASSNPASARQAGTAPAIGPEPAVQTWMAPPAHSTRGTPYGTSAFRFDTADPLDALTRDVLERRQRTLSNLWIFASLNYLYCDVVSLMDAGMLNQYASGTVEGMELNETFLMGATLYMQVPLSMVFLSSALPPRASRIANIAAGATTTAVQAATLFVGTPSKYYLASSIIEIATTSFIAVYAWRQLDPKRIQPTVSLTPGGGQVGMNVRF